MIYVLGANGFLGSAFARRCSARGLAWRAITRESYATLAGTACDWLVNANGNARKYLAAERPVDEFDRSVRSVRASLRDFDAGGYILLSSCDVYPDVSRPETTREEAPIDVATQTPYGFHKYLAELCVRHDAKRWLVFRGGGFVGPGLRKNAVYDVLHGGPLWVDPASEFQYLETDAAADIVLDVAAAGVTNEVFNLCARGVVSVTDVITMAGRTVAARPGSPRVRCEIDLDKLAARIAVPETRDTVASFLRGALAGRKT
ncbi:MAG: NAD(P)-dependent oxidoreductase [Armatimonadetes bacterium]|nr:NAD(P)-dependent oxidoreductase [Armatimonadota bacterium]